MKKKIFILLFIFLLLSVINVNAFTVVDCGNVTAIPKKIPDITSLIITIIQVAVPIVLVIFGMLDLFKGITAQKEEELKKGQQMFMKRLIIAAVIFFVLVIVRFLISVVADNKTETNDIIECMDCFLRDKCKNER